MLAVLCEARLSCRTKHLQTAHAVGVQRVSKRPDCKKKKSSKIQEEEEERSPPKMAQAAQRRGPDDPAPENDGRPEPGTWVYTVCRLFIMYTLASFASKVLMYGKQQMDGGGGAAAGGGGELGGANQPTPDRRLKTQFLVKLIAWATYASGERLEDLRSRGQLDRRRSGQSDTDLAMLDDWYQDLQELHRGAPEAVLDVQKSYLAHFNDRLRERPVS